MLRHARLPRSFLLAFAVALLTITSAAHAGLLDRLSGGGTSSQQAPLPPEQAFPFSAEFAGPQEIRARFDVKDGYYLYREKLRFELKDTEARVQEAILPSGEEKDDPYFGIQQILHQPFEVRLLLDRPLTGPAVLSAGYQGCAEAGLCYPPQTIDYPLNGAAAGASTPTASTATTAGTGTAAAATVVDEGDRLGNLLRGGEPLLILGGFFVAGLLLAFTACLYPMIPILSGLIAGDHHRHTGWRAFLLSLVYVEASAVTYALAGIVAGMSGVAVQANMQSPWVLGAFAGLFVLLALSMFGLYDLQLPSSWQTRVAELSRRQKGGSFIGVAIMGALSSLIVGACSGPALIAALAFISGTGDWRLGGLALFVLANGMGLPLLLIGTAAGKWLPRSGHWMNNVKRVFGVGFLAVALWMLDRILPSHVTLALWGALLLGCAVYLGAFDHMTVESTGPERARKFGGVLLLIWGFLLLLGAAVGGQSFWQPLGTLSLSRTSEAAPRPAFQPARNVAELEDLLSRAKAAGRPAVVDVYADWCVYCVQLERSTFPDPAVQAAFGDSLLIRLDVTANNADDKALLEKLGVFLPPAVIFYGRDGEERRELRVVGFLEPAAFAARARRALGGARS